MKCNGWSSIAAWNVALYINNHDESMTKECCAVCDNYTSKYWTVEQAIEKLESIMLKYFHRMKTPDGFNISRRSLKEWLITNAR